ncbi:hypothetical protein CXF85_11335 [Colwellia sp. 75C3]|uniref:AAA family ATPase n=1 Tax=Colwellia sp. 75C3 TaxID=888425 RepID=UPI000C340A5B|nr:AAA family ATPase [Colwellia sp. 75C3]PKG83314.1 hypothetical protein CXF85_11335 [Colwellia sp. 75C3]
MNESSVLSLLYKEDIQNVLGQLELSKSGNKSELITSVLSAISLQEALEHVYYQDIKYICSSIGITYTGKQESINNIIASLDNTDVSREDTLNSDCCENILGGLDSLVGLQKIKDNVRDLYNHISVNKQRKECGLQAVVVAKHMVFTGNPGTGKTTAARIIGKLFKEMGVVSKGHFKEVTKANLVGQYIGHTEKQVKKILEDAKGGVLFIDEAYSLFDKNSSDDSFGKAVVEALLTALENDRDDLVVIVAGYKNEMNDFLESNPGLKSRFSVELHFDDFSPPELIQIMHDLADKNDYIIEEPLVEKLKIKFEEEAKEKNFANARFVRNCFDKLIQKQASRLCQEKSFSEESLKSLTLADFNL